MRKLFLASCIFFSFMACHKKGNEDNPDLFSFKLISADNLQYDFSFLKDKKASVFIFLAPDCPLSQNYTLTLNSLFNQFQKDTVAFYGIIAGKSFEKKEVLVFVNKFKIKFPVLLDADLILTSYFNATKTPEVFVVNPNEKFLYQGAIDNWASDLGTHRSVITGHYLEDALKSIVQKTGIHVKETQAVGCFIERKL